MANQASYKPLNPNAAPYLRIPRSYLYVGQHRHLHPHNRLPPPPFYTPNIHFQPSPRKPPPPSPSSVKQLKLSLTPVPSGPRIPKSHVANSYRLGNSNVKNTKWVPKVAEGKRWKNNRRGYHKTLPLDEDTTSLMIKNIPNKYTRRLLIETLDNHCEVENKKINNRFVSAYDFVYLPIDFHCRTNAGFAFVNFTNPEAALGFRDAFNGKRWNLFDSSKVAEILKARIQGKSGLIDNCKGMYGSEEDMAVWFEPARDGSGEVGSKMFTVGRIKFDRR